MADELNQLLHIYDAESISIRATAWARRNSGIGHLLTYPVPVVGGIRGLQGALDKLVADGETFQRALFETHGGVGHISFDGERIDADVLRSMYRGRGYEKIFPWALSKIYFNGCAIADGNDGWSFLDTAGSVFLRMAGGVTLAQTGPGRIVLPWAVMTGHVVHFSADTCYSFILAGGAVAGHRRD
jgi:hypothetical protein